MLLGVGSTLDRAKAIFFKLFALANRGRPCQNSHHSLQTDNQWAIHFLSAEDKTYNAPSEDISDHRSWW